MTEPNFLTPEERMKLWADTLSSLAEPDRCRQLIGMLNDGEGSKLEELLEPTRIFQFGGCIDIVETLIKVLNFGPGHYEARCSVIARLRPPNPSPVNGLIYQLSNGKFVFVTEVEWWSYYDRAWKDPSWLAQNRDFLQTLGIISCHQTWVSDSSVVSIERTRTICFPDVIHPYDRGPAD